MAGKPVTIDVDEFNRAYQAELPVNVERVNKAIESAHAKVGAQPMSLISISDAQGTVCDNWPNIRKLINTILKFTWVLKLFGVDKDILQFAPQVKAFLAAFDKTIVPVICGKPTQPPV